jgi:Na+/H+ antiporter NhaB
VEIVDSPTEDASGDVRLKKWLLRAEFLALAVRCGSSLLSLSLLLGGLLVSLLHKEGTTVGIVVDVAVVWGRVDKEFVAAEDDKDLTDDQVCSKDCNLSISGFDGVLRRLFVLEALLLLVRLSLSSVVHG